MPGSLPPTPATPFGNGWNEYRRLFLEYMEEEKSWRKATDRRLSEIEKTLAVFCSQKLMDTLEEIREEQNKAKLSAALTRKEVKGLIERQKLSRANQVKIWIAVIGGLAGLVTAIVEIFAK